MMRSPFKRLFTVIFLSSCTSAIAADLPWPAESILDAVNLTHIEGPGVNDFHVNLSGAYWNPQIRRLWVCRNGGPGGGSKFWALKEDGAGSFEVDYKDGLRGEWSGFGDLEDLTQADLFENSIYLMVEGQERIKEFDVSTYGVAILRNDWDTRPYLPLYGDSGAEGIAFIPDYYLQAGGFVDSIGAPRVSQNGMGGLMFVAHQNGGRIYVFDLNRQDSTFTFVGSYLTNYHESCALSFDRSSGYLYILHGANHNRVEVTSLSSSFFNGERRLNEILTYGRPTNSALISNMEGIAVVSGTDCNSHVRKFFLTVDDGGPDSLFMFSRFPCLDIGDVNGDGAINGLDIQGSVENFLEIRPRPNSMGTPESRSSNPNIEPIVRRLLDL